MKQQTKNKKKNKQRAKGGIWSYLFWMCLSFLVVATPNSKACGFVLLFSNLVRVRVPWLLDSALVFSASLLKLGWAVLAAVWFELSVSSPPFTFVSLPVVASKAKTIEQPLFSCLSCFLPQNSQVVIVTDVMCEALLSPCPFFQHNTQHTILVLCCVSSLSLSLPFLFSVCPQRCPILVLLSCGRVACFARITFVSQVVVLQYSVGWLFWC